MSFPCHEQPSEIASWHSGKCNFIVKLFVSLLFLTSFLLGTSSARATSIIFPKFSAPIFEENRLIFTSPEANRLLCADLNGKIVWERKYDFRINLFAGPKAEALVQTGKVVCSISPQTGDLKTLFSVEDDNDEVTFSIDANSFISRDRRFGKQMFKLLDATTGQPLWKTQEVATILGVTPEIIVCLSVELTPLDQGYTHGKTSLNGYARDNFTRKWSVPLSGNIPAPLVSTAFKSPFLFYAEGDSSITVLDCSTGRKLFTKPMNVPDGVSIGGLKIYGQQLVWLTSKTDLKDFKNTEHYLHFSTVPELKEDKTTVLKLIEIARVSFESGFIISESLYRTACFQLDGSKIWERFQTTRTQVINNRIYFSDNDKETARLGFVEASTGKEKILYTEKIPSSKR